MFCKLCVTEAWPTSVGLLHEGKTYAIPQEVYKNEVFGKVGHTNFGLCGSNDAETPSVPSLPEILSENEPDTDEPVKTPKPPTKKKK